MAIYCNNLGMAGKALGEYEKAIGYLEQALDTFKRSLGEDHPYTIANGIANGVTH